MLSTRNSVLSPRSHQFANQRLAYLKEYNSAQRDNSPFSSDYKGSQPSSNKHSDNPSVGYDPSQFSISASANETPVAFGNKPPNSGQNQPKSSQDIENQINMVHAISKQNLRPNSPSSLYPNHNGKAISYGNKSSTPVTPLSEVSPNRGSAPPVQKFDTPQREQDLESNVSSLHQ